VGENQELFPYTDDLNQLISQIAHLIGTYQPEVIITHGSNGEYGHPAHILTHKGVRKAVEDLRHSAPLLYTFCADFPGHPRPRHANPDDPAHLILDVRPAMAQKTRAAYCHRSQHALFLRRRSQKAGYRLTIPEILLDLESLHRVYPPVGGEPQDAVITALAPWKKTPQETMLYS
jgi:LmbE family N-acetylglucosaminyl deacetylase